ncbi:MAG TPA: hypothetical protein PK995_03165 [Bacteroidia bacterium]|nr:hypothetical protein [Bacteroidia bacterium]
MLYITFNDYPGGIFESQVIDVIQYLNKLSHQKIRLISFVSLRNFFSNRKKIKSLYPYSIVIPMFPGIHNWQWNRIFAFFLILIFYKSSVICRGIFAFDLFYPFKKIGLLNKIIFDGRGAYKSEFEEYLFPEDKKLIDKVYSLEFKAVMYASFRIAVSQALVNYWKENYGYIDNDYVVIPCTLSKKFIRNIPEKSVVLSLRQKMGFVEDDVIVVFSGSSAGWQSMVESDILFLELLNKSSKVKLLFLGNHDVEKFMCYKKFPDRVFQKSVSVDEVFDYLVIADYGWLVREQSITNKVASPVKFAEYLVCGLKVIISENLGDYTDFCRKHNCGIIVSNSSIKDDLNKIDESEKNRIHQLAIQYFTKEKYENEYRKVLNSNK